MDFRNQLGELIEAQNLEVEVAVNLVPSPDHAGEVYLTAEGFRPYPLAEIIAMLQGKPVPAAKTVVGSIGSLPTLVTAGF